MTNKLNVLKKTIAIALATVFFSLPFADDELYHVLTLRVVRDEAVDLRIQEQQTQYPQKVS